MTIIRGSNKYTPIRRSVPNAIVPTRSVLPRLDLTLFGGSAGNRRYYKNEKESVPEFTSHVEDEWHTAGDNIVLKVQYKGHPEPIVHWFKGQELVSCTMRIVITADGSLTELAIFDAQRTDGAYYSCRIENDSGVRETGCHVFIEDRYIPPEERGRYGRGLGSSPRLYRSVLYTPSQRYRRF